MTQRLKVVGFDPSLNNWGIAHGFLTISERSVQVSVEQLGIVQPTKLEGKQVRNNSKDLHRAEQLIRGALAAAQGATAVFVEVPHGSQSARAMASYGMCVGVLGALRAHGVPFFEVTAGEVKLVTGLKKDASKFEMIRWALGRFPDANWPTYQQNGATYVQGDLDVGRAEHMADACAAIEAGIAGTEFQKLLPFIRQRVQAA